MCRSNRLMFILEQIITKESDLEYMCRAWAGDDPYEAAASDPGLQFELGEEINELWAEFDRVYKE